MLHFYHSCQLFNDPVDVGGHLGIDAGELGITAAQADGDDTHQLVVAVGERHQRASRVALTGVAWLVVPAAGAHLGSLEATREGVLELGYSLVGGLTGGRIEHPQRHLLQDIRPFTEELQHAPAGHLHVFADVLGAGWRQADGLHVLVQLHGPAQPHHGQVVLRADVLRMPHDTGDAPLLVGHLGPDGQVVVGNAHADGAGFLRSETVGSRQHVPVGDEGAAAEPVAQLPVRPSAEDHHPSPAMRVLFSVSRRE